MSWTSTPFQLDNYHSHHHEHTAVEPPQLQQYPIVHMPSNLHTGRSRGAISASASVQLIPSVVASPWPISNVRETTDPDVPFSTTSAHNTPAGIRHTCRFSPQYPSIQLPRQANHEQNIDNHVGYHPVMRARIHALSQITNENTGWPQQWRENLTVDPIRYQWGACHYTGLFQAEPSLIRELENFHFTPGLRPYSIQDPGMVSMPRNQLGVLVREAHGRPIDQISSHYEQNPEAVGLRNVEQLPGTRASRPASRGDFEIAVICALTVEQDAVLALFDHHWDDNGLPYDKRPCDPNAYSYGAIGRHNIVLAHMPGIGKASATAVAVHCQVSFPNLKLALIVGVCGALPFMNNGQEIILGDIIISDGIIQYDFGRQYPGQFVRKNALLDSPGRPNPEIRAHLAKLKSRRGRTVLRDMIGTHLHVLQSDPQLKTDYQYPGTEQDVLYQPGSNIIIPRQRLEKANPMPDVHFGLVASGDTIMKFGQLRDCIAMAEGVIAFEMEGAGVSDNIPHVIIKGVSDYADSHKTKVWQHYAAATAAACMKAFLETWVPAARSC
ncbi:purine and uridine phosphorylase [Aspergillus uvarum CBS 121591]|uniref:Purine and uridine phosphorylase n=1 Tax=Aspergillus uvarum CBS 121591 TaxID=1448315 RepID=A0A319C536_9EURO|nr:purine and uridine phosphorylase [Aspergillus uvarum CBS 121591]PYH79080.1 purine and uridine phosphorylase [Aspergillus uvarum CBS 121591]